MNPTDAIILHLAPVPGRSFGVFFSASQLASSPDRLSVEAVSMTPKQCELGPVRLMSAFT
jgi:hypothetical protein